MKNNWIPKPNEIVEFLDKQWIILSVNLGGKCTIKSQIGSKKMTDVDVSELKPLQ